MSLSRTVSEINGDLSRNRNSLHVFNALLKGFPYELGTDARIKN